MKGELVSKQVSKQAQELSKTQHSFKPKQRSGKSSDRIRTTKEQEGQQEDVNVDGNFFSTDHLFVNSVGLSHNFSSSTLRHASPQFSFPHALRFSGATHTNSPTQIDLPSMLGHKTTTQGFGTRSVFQWKYQETKARILPSPDLYEVQRVTGKDALKKTFGISFENYSKIYLPYNKSIPLDVAKTLPGPGGYNITKELAQHRYQYSLKGKGKMVNDVRDWGFPGPEKYTPSNKITFPSRFACVSQGIGGRKNPFGSKSFTPGPGRYTLPSPFDKFLRKKKTAVSDEIQ